jgi:hypothetical protein
MVSASLRSPARIARSVSSCRMVAGGSITSTRSSSMSDTGAFGGSP